MFMLAFANKYEAPGVIPQEFGFKWWAYVLNQPTLVSSITLSFLIAAVTTVLSMVICLPAAYVLARYDFPGRRAVMFSFLLGNAFPKIGIYTSIGIIFYRIGLMGTFPGAWPGIAVAAMFAFIGSLGENQGTLLVGLPKYRTMPVEMYGVILDYPATAGAVFALILLIPNILLLTLMRRYVGPETLSKGFKM